MWPLADKAPLPAAIASKQRLALPLGLGMVVLTIVGTTAAMWPSGNEPGVVLPQATVSAGSPAMMPPPLTSLPALPGQADALGAPPLSEDDAFARNAAVPFVTGAIAPAASFQFTGGAQDRSRAVDCLALAAMAEAGSGDEGQRAVMQVVLNRVRHPAFAHTICGVVFEGSQRASGCQFTFTCDGSLNRPYSNGAWQSARRRASAALDGYVYSKVGTATHYHTDWVYPYWSPSLDKVARVDTHLFFRWKGYWGTWASFRSGYGGGETALTELMQQAGAEPESDAIIPVMRKADKAGNVIRKPEGGAFLIGYASLPSAAQALATARKLCGGSGYCQVMGWADRSAMPLGFPVSPAARARLSFSYVLDARNTEIVLYDCRMFTGIERDHCIPAPSRPT